MAIEVWGNWFKLPLSTTATTTSTNLWYDNSWCASGTSATTITIADEVWGKWRGNYEWNVVEPAVELGADRLQELREQETRRQLERERSFVQREEQRARAHDRGLDLLYMLLDSDQKQEIEEKNEFTVRGSAGGLYVIELDRRTVHGNIRRIDEHGCSLGRMCVAPGMRVGTEILPISDGWVGQLLGLQCHEELVTQRAHWSFQQPCRQLVPTLENRAA